MTRENAALIRRVQARLRKLQPDLAAALLASLDRIVELLPESQLIELLSGSVGVDSVLTSTLLARGFIPYRAAIRAAVESGVRLTIPDLPKIVGRAAPRVSTLFNYLDPVVIDAVRSLENKALATLTDNVRGVTRAFVENGIRDGLNVNDMARGLRTTIGMAPHQQRYVSNLERELRELSPKFQRRELRDKRFDKTILRHIEQGKPIPEEKIRQIADAYRRKFTAHNTEVVTRQTAIDSYREGQRLSWHSAVENGFVDGDTLGREWVHSDIVETPRPEHVALDGTVVRWNQPYPNGQLSAGSGDHGCQCADRFFVMSPAQSRRIAAGPAPANALF